jgi:hypothetical protein
MEDWSTVEPLMAGVRLGLQPPQMRDLMLRIGRPSVELPRVGLPEFGGPATENRPERSFPWYEATGEVQPPETFGWK